jgi:hypothetical protein
MDAMTRLDTLLQEVLALPARDRARVLEELSLSLDADPADADDAVLDELDADSAAVVEARVADALAHPERAQPLAEAIAGIRAELARRKS